MVTEQGLTSILSMIVTPCKYAVLHHAVRDGEAENKVVNDIRIAHRFPRVPGTKEAECGKDCDHSAAAFLPCNKCLLGPGGFM